MWKATGTAFFQRSELDLSALSHFSAGGQLLHPSEVKSSMSELCVSPLSNVVAGIGDAGRATISIKRSATLKPNQVVFILSVLRRPGSTIPATGAIRQTRSLLFRLIAQRPFVPTNDHRLAARWL